MQQKKTKLKNGNYFYKIYKVFYLNSWGNNFIDLTSEKSTSFHVVQSIILEWRIVFSVRHQTDVHLPLWVVVLLSWKIKRRSNELCKYPLEKSMAEPTGASGSRVAEAFVWFFTPRNQTKKGSAFNCDSNSSKKPACNYCCRWKQINYTPRLVSRHVEKSARIDLCQWSLDDSTVSPAADIKMPRRD